MEFVESEYRINQRVSDLEGYKGTIRYIGPVITAKNPEDIWLGIDWENPARGKHDGSCVDSNNVIHRYFECLPGSGSFVKTNKITKGISFIQALHEKYVGLDAPQIAPDDVLPDAFVATSKGVLKSIEFVGEKKIRQRQQIEDVKKIALRNMLVSEIGDGVTELAGHLTEVDLQDNLFCRWDEILQLASQLPHLNNLLLHGNKLGDLSSKDIENNPLARTSLLPLLILALNSCGVSTWSSVINLEAIAPNLQELYLAANKLEDLGSFPPFATTQFPQLRILDLSSCGIPTWASMSAALGPLALLEELLLDSNPISEISPAPENHFVSLRRLSLSGTGLSTWHDIDCLLTFPSFVQLRLTNIPLFSGKGASEIRPEVIGRLSNLQLFNGSAVSVKERIDSEKSYLRKILRQKSNLESGGTYITELGIVYDQEILGNHFFQNIIHPKYNELNEKYGEELASYGTANQIGTGPQSIASDMITIRIKNLVFSCGNGMMEPVEKKIPGSLTVERLRLMIKQIYGIEPRAQNLSIRQDKNSMPTLMDDDSATLRYYGVIEGSDVFVNEAD